MVLDAVSNFVRGRVAAAVDDTQTTVSVDDASIFPDPETDGEFNVVMWDANNFPRPDQDADVEVMRVTAVDTGTDELTVTRAQEGTSDVAHPEGSAVHLSPTAKMFSDIEAEYTAQGENFDGEGTSEFSNLQSVSTEDLNTVRYVDPSMSSETINDVIDEVHDLGGGMVVFQRGEYELAEDETRDTTHPTAIEARGQVDLVGMGRDTVLKVTDRCNVIFAETGDGYGSPSPASDFTVSNMMLDGNGDVVGEGDDPHHGQTGILLYGFNKNVKLERLWVKNTVSHGYHIDANIGTRVVDCRGFDDANTHFSTRDDSEGKTRGNLLFKVRGCHFWGIDGKTNVVFLSNQAIGCGVYETTVRDSDSRAFRLGGYGTEAVGCSAYNVDRGVFIDSQIDSDGEPGAVNEGISLRGIYVEDSDSNPYRIAECENSEMIDCRAKDVNSTGIFVLDSPDFEITACRVENTNGSRGIRFENSPGLTINGGKIDDTTGLRGDSADTSDDVSIVNFTARAPDEVQIQGWGDNWRLNNVTAERDDDGRNIDARGVNWIIDGQNTNGGIRQRERTVVGKRSPNDGNPETEGDWNGHAEFAEDHGVTVVDENTGDAWIATDGSFRQIVDTS